MKAFLPFKYVMMLMGFFATYVGFMYNEFFSIPLNLFGSCYEGIVVFYISISPLFDIGS